MISVCFATEDRRWRACGERNVPQILGARQNDISVFCTEDSRWRVCGERNVPQILGARQIDISVFCK
jgi:hypothetical protein